MLWPTPADYAQAVGGYPDVCLLDPKLKGGKPKKTPANQLHVYTGGFSTVFPIDVVYNNYALRCWYKEIGDSKNRYEKIDDYLKQVQLPYFVGFEYVPEGILIDGKKWPITRMEWVNGETLRDFIEHNLHDPNIFAIVADEFQKMFESLHVHNISHGDLQSGNIMLRKNGKDISIKLIDYDSLFVPALRGHKSPTPGLPEYQHPSRNDICDEKMDYFSELVIYLSFLSLSENTKLWNECKGKTEKGLLFSGDDLENPGQSDIFKELDSLSPEIQKLTATLKDYCAITSIDQLQPLEAILPKPDFNTHTNDGFSLLNDKRYDEAIREFQNAIILKSDHKEAYNGIGLAYLHSQKYSEAISAFSEAIGIEPKYKDAYFGLGLTYHKSGDDIKATASLNEAIKIDPHFHIARQLLDAIKKPPTPPEPQPALDVWRNILKKTAKNWQHIASGLFAVGFICCLIAFLTQMNSNDELLAQNTDMKNQLAKHESDIRQKSSKISTLNASNITLKRENGRLTNENRTLQEKLDNITISDIKSIQNVDRLQKQLNDQKSLNRQLKNQIAGKDIEIRKFQRGESDVLNIIPVLERQLEQKKLEIESIETRFKNLQKENNKIQLEKVKLQNENKSLISQNGALQTTLTSLRKQIIDIRKSPSKKEVVQKRLNEEKQGSIVELEQPKEVDVYKDSATLASATYNNNGIKAFKREDYEKAISLFKQAVSADSNLAPSHFNLGCAYSSNRKYLEAIRAFTKAIALDKRYYKAFYNRSLVYFQLKMYSAAKKDAESAIRINRKYQRPRNLLSKIEEFVK